MKTRIAKIIGRRHSEAMPDNQNTPGFLDVQKLESGAHGVTRPTFSQSGSDFRTVKATIASAEMGAVQWAAKRTLRVAANGSRGPVPLADFLREALLEKVRATVKAEIDAGRNVPADIAHVVSSFKLKVEG